MKKAAFITGAAKRIGSAIALSLAESGYDIALHYNRSGNEALELQKAILAKGVICKLFKADFNEEAQVLSLLDDVRKEFFYLNLLINNASLFEKKNIFETEADFFNRIINVNFKAPFFLTRSFVKIFKKGNVINILDTKIIKNDFNYSIYTISKKALCEFTKMSAKEFGPDVRINAIAPGYILAPEGTEPSYLEKMIKNLPMKEKGSLKNITDSLDFILKNNYLTGEVLFVDGGQHL